MTDNQLSTKFENGNSKLGLAHPAHPVSSSDSSDPATSPQNSKFDPTQNAPAVSNFDLRISANPLLLTPQQLQFLSRVTSPALESQLRYEVPACVTLAQAILESATPQFGWGSSSLFRLANNPFGIKYEHLGAADSGPGKGDSTFRIPDSGSRTQDSEFVIQNKIHNPGSDPRALRWYATGIAPQAPAEGSKQ